MIKHLEYKHKLPKMIYVRLLIIASSVSGSHHRLIRDFEACLNYWNVNSMRFA
jgi:hypothetical protein